MKRRGFCGAAGAMLLGSALPRRVLAAPGRKRVACLIMLNIKESADPKVMFRDAFAKEFTELGLRPGSDLEVVPFVLPMKSDWNKVTAKAVGEISRGGFDGAIVEGEYLVRRLQEAAPGLPIVAYLHDPVLGGFAKSVAKPGGNVTGVHRGTFEVATKQIEFLRRIVPGVSRMAWISFRPQLEVTWPPFAAAAKASGVEVRQVLIEGGIANDIRPGLQRDFAALRKDGYACGSYQTGIKLDIDAVSALALEHRIALGVQGNPGDVKVDGLLFVYRPLRDGVSERLAASMAKILRGARPGDIPFEGPSLYYFGVNLRTAERIGVEVPRDLLVFADEVIR